jgi:hypothetical protein
LLGELAERRGDVDQAVQYYQNAASAGGEVGQAAQERLVRYDLPTNPNRYLASGLQRAGTGEIIAVVRNNTGLEVSSVQIRVTNIRTGSARTFFVTSRLAPGEQAATGTGVIDSTSNYRVAVIAAEVR